MVCYPVVISHKIYNVSESQTIYCLNSLGTADIYILLPTYWLRHDYLNFQGAMAVSTSTSWSFGD
jgi:hypothetical protein